MGWGAPKQGTQFPLPSGSAVPASGLCVCLLLCVKDFLKAEVRIVHLES